jgi:hypothetical protein
MLRHHRGASHFSCLLAEELRQKLEQERMEATQERCIDGCLHVLIDELNVNDDCAKYCLSRAIENEHSHCIKLAEILVAMTKTQRLKLSHGGYARGLQEARTQFQAKDQAQTLTKDTP